MELGKLKLLGWLVVVIGKVQGSREPPCSSRDEEKEMDSSAV